MDQAILLETRSDEEVRCGENVSSDTRDIPMESSPLHKVDSAKSLPNRVDEIEPEFFCRNPLKGVASEPRPRTKRCSSIDMMALQPSRLFEDETLSPVGEDFDLGLKQRKRKKSDQRRKSRSPDGPRRRDSVPRAHQLRPRAPWLISAEHPLKIVWDIATVILSIANAYATHVSIRERRFSTSPFGVFCFCWFLVDILLNFVTERKTVEGDILRDYNSIAARYLTSWFAIDALSLFPWERVYVKPIIDLQNSRGFFKKSFFRSKAVVRVTTHLRSKHFRWFGKVARQTKQHGIGASRLLRLIIKYLPKYILFLRNMKGIVAMRLLRQFNYLRRFYTNVIVEEKDDAMTESLTRHDEPEDDLSSGVSFGDSRRVQVVYENWELVDDDDDGVPL